MAVNLLEVVLVDDSANLLESVLVVEDGETAALLYLKQLSLYVHDSVYLLEAVLVGARELT